MLYRIVRLIAVALLALAVVVPAVTYVALSVTPVQRRIARIAERELSKALNAKVEIGSLGIVPFNRAVLREVVITDRTGADTILTARRLGAGIRIGSLLSDDPLTITHVELIGMDARIHRASPGAPLNIQPIIDALSPKNHSRPPTAFDFKINTIMIRSSRLSYDVLSEATTEAFGPSHIAISNLRADINAPRLRRGDFAFFIKRMGFTGPSGFRLESLTANATLADSIISVDNLALTLPRSSLRIDDITLPTDRLADVLPALRRHTVRLNVAPGSYISPADFAAFIPALGSLPDRIDINRLSIDGNLKGADIDIDLADSHTTRLRIEGSGRHPADPDRATANIHNFELHTTGSEAARIAGCFTSLSPKLKAMATRMGAIDMAATANLIARDFDVTLSTTCAQGQTELFAEGAFRSIHSFSVEGELASIGAFRVGQLLDNPELGDADGSIALTYAADGRNRRGHAELNIDRFDFRHIAYREILADATLDGDMLTFSAETDGDALSFNLAGAWSLARDFRAVRLDGSVGRFVPNQLNLTEKYPGVELAADFNMDLEGPQLHNMLGHIDIRNFSIRRSPSEVFTLDHLGLKSDQGQLRLESDFINGTIQGSYDFRHIGRAASAIASRILPSVVATPSRQLAGTDTPNDFTFRFRVGETERAAEFFRLPVSVIYPVEITGEMNESTSDMALAIDAPYLRQGNKLIENTRVSALLSGADANGSFDFTTTAPTQNGPLHLALSANAERDRLNTDVAWKIAREEAYNGHLSALTNFWREEAPDSPLHTEINILPGSLTFNDSTWRVAPAKVSLRGPKDIAVDGINVHRANQFVRINGTVGNDAASLLTLDLRNFNLDYLFESLGIDKVKLGGDATGTFYASRLFTPEPILETPGLCVNGISYNKVVLGNALVRSHWERESRAITLNAIIDQPDRRKAFVDGAIFPLNDSLDIRFKVDHTDVAFMQPYMEAFASDISGHASGECRLWGNFKYIDLEGDVFADDLRLKINFTNTYYTATDSVHFRPGLIDLNGITIRDAEGHTADLNGWVRHKFFKEPWFEFSISNARNFLAYNETAKDNPIWYGKIYGDGGAAVKGAPGRIDINVDMATAPKSTFTFVLSDQEVADEYSFLTFRDKKSLSAELTDTVKLERDTSMDLVERLRAMVRDHAPDLPSDYNISLQMRVTPQATLVLVMDPVGVDRIRAWGNGHLRLDYGSANNDLRMYGTYTLDRGYYNFTLQDVIIKDFTIKPGSEIVFNGDPYAAQLNIQAVYALNANLSDLDESFLQDQDLNRTNVPVHALMKVTGDIRQPEIAFDLEFPTLTSDVYRKVRSIVSTDDMMNRQIIYLLALNRFYTPEYMTSTTKGNELVSVASSTISSQLSNLLGQISDNWNIAPTFRSDRGDFSDVEVDVALSSRLLNNRLLFNGNFGYRDNSLNSNQFIGDFDLEYLLDREGRWRLKAYNRYNDQNYYLRTAKTTQGVGVVLKRDFDSFSSFFNFFRRKKKSAAPADSTATPNPSRQF